MRLRFILGEVFSGLRRNGTMALSVVLVTFVSLTFVGAAALTQFQVDNLKDDWYDKVEVSVFLCPDNSPDIQCPSGRATPAQEDAIRAVLEDGAASSLVVKPVYYESREAMIANLHARDKDNRFASLTADQGQASFRVKLTDPTQFEKVADAVSGLSGVEKVKDQREIFKGLFGLLNAATLVAAGLAAVMLLAAVLLITTTIRLSAMSRRSRPRSCAWWAPRAGSSNCPSCSRARWRRRLGPSWHRRASGSLCGTWWRIGSSSHSRS